MQTDFTDTKQKNRMNGILKIDRKRKQRKKSKAR